jgi:hypothetical protein
MMRLTTYGLMGLAFVLISHLSFAEDTQSVDQILAQQNFFSSSFVDAKQTNAKHIIPSADPKIYAGADKIADKQRMEEKGFELIGYSDFKAGDVPPEMAMPQAKKIHAEIVLVYSERSDRPSASAKVQAIT